MELMIGADPEVFVKDRWQRNVSGHDMIPGTKRKPFPVECGAVQVDGTALEFNIAPAKTYSEFIHNVSMVLAQLKSMIPEGYSLALEAVAQYEAEYFRNLPDEVKAMGCDPDFDAYTGIEIAREAGDRTFRTAAGHIHLGWTQGEDPFKARHYQSCRTLVKELDIWLGLPSVIFDPESGPRRQLYGKAGSFRPKPYGVEYRVLSNKWLQSEDMMSWVFSQSKRCFDFLMSRNRPISHRLSADTVQAAINESQPKEALALLKYVQAPNLLMPDGTSFAPPIIEKKPAKKVIREGPIEANKEEIRAAAQEGEVWARLAAQRIDNAHRIAERAMQLEEEDRQRQRDQEPPHWQIIFDAPPRD